MYMMNEARSVTKTAETFARLIWFPKIGDQVKLNGIKDTIAGLGPDGSVFLSKFPQHPYRAHQLEYRPTPQDYIGLIAAFTPSVVNLVQEPTGKLVARCQSGPFPFTARGRPKQLLAKLLQTRLHLTEVNARVNLIVEQVRSAGANNVPKLRLVHSVPSTAAK